MNYIEQGDAFVDKNFGRILDVSYNSHIYIVVYKTRLGATKRKRFIRSSY